MKLSHVIERARVVVVVGPGGVGKTTASAALALAAARAGRRVLVLTADPARRLADALGLPRDADGSDKPVPVPVGAGPGRLDAAMVLTGSSYDRLIARLAPSPRARQAILDNPMYRAFSRTLARSHAYVAMERLHDALHDGRTDLVVLDTPPASSAVELLDAPGRLRRFLDARSVRWLLPPQGRPTRAPGRLLRATLGRLFGAELLGQSLDFFSAFAGLREVLASRATRMAHLLRSDQAAFVLVAAQGPSALATAATLADDLAARGLPLHALVFNRAYHVLDEAHPERVLDTVPPLGTAGLPEPLRGVASLARSLRAELAAANARAARARAALVTSLTVVRPTPSTDAARDDLAGGAIASDSLGRAATGTPSLDPTGSPAAAQASPGSRAPQRVPASEAHLAIALVPELAPGPAPLDDLARMATFLLAPRRG